MLKKRNTLDVQAVSSAPEDSKTSENSLISPEKRRSNFLVSALKQTSFSTDTSAIESSAVVGFKVGEAPQVKQILIESCRIEEADEAKENSPDSGLLDGEDSESDEEELIIAVRPV